MLEIHLKNGKNIKEYGEPYFVAELNSSHNGNMELAKKMIDSAKDVGCDCVKFQSWTPDTLYSKGYYDKNPISKRIVKKFSLSDSDLRELSIYCKNCKIDFASTPYSEHEVDFLIEECDVPFIKVASMEINNIPFLKYIAKKNIPIILATGMADINEIHKAVDSILETGNEQLCVLHCVSIYPAPLDMVNLRNIRMLQNEFPDLLIGYSDHTKGSEAAMGAVAMGSCLIEKHFTLDSTVIGMDNQMATEPDDMKKMIERCKRMYTAVGSYDRIVSVEEMEQRKKMRRSLVAAKDLTSGQVICSGDVMAMRPGTGLEPEYMEKIIGCKITQDIECGTMISKDNIEMNFN